MADTKLSANGFLAYLKNRRTYYPLSKDISLSNAEVDTIVSEAVQAVPSSFNSQSNRAIVLHGSHHDKLWTFVHDALAAIVPAENFQPTADKIAMFKGAAGTILFFEDQTVVEGLQEKFAPYADKFPTWAVHSSGMLQYAIWTALEAEGLGANLQHYNPLIDAQVAAEWKVPSSWTLSAQLVFGGRTGDAGPKEFAPLEQKFKTFSD